MAATVAWTWWAHNPLEFYPRRVDLQVYVDAGRVVLDGGSLYDFRTAQGLPFTYPPIAAIPFIPLALLDFTFVKLLAFGWTWASTVLLSWLIVRHAPVFRPGGLFAALPTGIAWPAVTIPLAMSHPVMSNNRFGQISLVLIAAIALDVLVIMPRWPRAGGIITGVAAAIKLTPLAVLPMLWLGGRRRAAYVGTATFVGLGLVGLAIFPAQTLDYLLNRAGDMTRFGPYDSPSNQSINGALFRAGLDGTSQKLLFLALAGTVLILAWRRSGRLLRSGDPFTALVVCGAAMIAASPISWGHHQAWLWIAAFAVVSSTAWQQIGWMALVMVMLSKAPIGAVTDGQVPPLDWLINTMRGFLAVAIVVYVGATRGVRRTRSANQRAHCSRG